MEHMSTKLIKLDEDGGVPRIVQFNGDIRLASPTYYISREAFERFIATARDTKFDEVYLCQRCQIGETPWARTDGWEYVDGLRDFNQLILIAEPSDTEWAVELYAFDTPAPIFIELSIEKPEDLSEIITQAEVENRLREVLKEMRPKGEIEMWKFARVNEQEPNNYIGAIVHLKIRKRTDRHAFFNGALRARSAVVLGVYYIDTEFNVLEDDGTRLACSFYDHYFEYKKGKVARPTEAFDENPFVVCSSGINGMQTIEKALELMYLCNFNQGVRMGCHKLRYGQFYKAMELMIKAGIIDAASKSEAQNE